MWVHKCSGNTDRLTDKRNSVCRKYSKEIVPAAIVSFMEGMTNFVTINQCGGYSDPFLHVLSHRGKHFENCYLSSRTVQSEQNLEGKSTTCV